MLMRVGILVVAAFAATVPARAADMPESRSVRAYSYSSAGTVWRAGPPPAFHEDRPYVRVIPVRERRVIRSRTVYEARPLVTK